MDPSPYPPVVPGPVNHIGVARTRVYLVQVKAGTHPLNEQARQAARAVLAGG